MEAEEGMDIKRNDNSPEALDAVSQGTWQPISWRNKPGSDPEGP